MDSQCYEASSKTCVTPGINTELELLVTIDVTECTGHFNLWCSDYKMPYK